MMKGRTPIMYLEVLEAIHEYFKDEDDIEADCLVYLSRLKFDNKLSSQLGSKAKDRLSEMNRCDSCGEKLQTMHFTEFHTEIGPYVTEEVEELYCPNCDFCNKGDIV